MNEESKPLEERGVRYKLPFTFKIFLFVIFAIVLSPDAFAQMFDPGRTIDLVEKELSKEISSWEDTIFDAALYIFFALAVIDWVWTFGQYALGVKGEGNSLIAEIIRKIIYLGFFYWLLTNGVSHAEMIFKSFAQMGSTVLDSPTDVTPAVVLDESIETAWDIVNVGDSSGGGGILGALDRMAAVLQGILMIPFAFLVLVVGALSAAILFSVMIELYVTAYAGILVLGFGSSSWTNQYAINYYRTMFATSFKYFITVLIVSMSFNMTKAMSDINQLDNFYTVISISAVLILTIWVQIRAPMWITNLLAGSTLGNSGQDTFGTGSTVGAAAVGAGVSAVGAGSAVQSAWSLAGAQGQAASIAGSGANAGQGAIQAGSQALSSDINSGGASGGDSGSGGGIATRGDLNSAGGGTSVHDAIGSVGQAALGAISRTGQTIKNLGGAAASQIGSEVQGTSSPKGTVGGRMAAQMNQQKAELQADIASASMGGESNTGGSIAGGLTAASGIASIGTEAIDNAASNDNQESRPQMDSPLQSIASLQNQNQSQRQKGMQPPQNDISNMNQN